MSEKINSREMYLINLALQRMAENMPERSKREVADLLVKLESVDVEQV